MGSGINNKINEFLCNPKNFKKRRNTRLEKCYGHVNIATAFLKCVLHIYATRKILFAYSETALKKDLMWY